MFLNSSGRRQQTKTLTTNMIFPLLILTFLHQSVAHVSLIFPPARKYDLDFLDKFRTTGPCGGMPKGDIVTTIVSGQEINFEWHLGYAHPGGFKLELIDEQGTVQKGLTSGFVSKGCKSTKIDECLTNLSIDIPNNIEGKKIVRLTRQATNWGKSYVFHSCADVEFVKLSNYQNDCNGHGTASGSTCNCEKTHSGDKCQYIQDCETDSDCNGGECVPNVGTVLPKKECYCPLGSFGRKCEKVSSITSKVFDPTLYKTESFVGGNFKFLYRYIDTETMEGIIKAKTTNFVAVGWREKHSTLSCQSFPLDVKKPKYSELPKGKMHAMDCQDIIIGRARGNFSNIGDYYTRDRSTPRRDEVYGGKDDLIAAAGWEENGETTIMFQRPVSSDDANTDNDFRAQMTFVWAHGQSGKQFYKDDELKYHGNPKADTVITRGSKDFCPGQCETGLSRDGQRTLTLVAGILLFLSMGIQMVQNLSEGMNCGGKSKTKESISMEKLN